MDNVELHLEQHLSWIPSRLIYLTRHGSRAYGTAEPDSDVDLRGVVVPPLRYFLGFVERFEQTALKEPSDVVLHGLQCLFEHAANADPNVLEILFTDESDHLVVHELGRALLQHRELFLSRRVLHTYTGFAARQRKKVQARVDRLSSADADHAARVDVLLGINSKRRALIEKHGYDTKDAAQMVRLLRVAREVLTGRGLIVRRPDAEDLRRIREGCSKWEELRDWALAEEAALGEIESRLPAKPDRAKLDELCVALAQASFNFEVDVPVMQPGFASEPWSFGSGALSEKDLTIREVAE